MNGKSKPLIIIVFVLFAASFFVLILNVGSCRENEAIGRIIAMEGVITVNSVQTHLNAPVCLGDVIHTGTNSRTDLKLLDSNIIFRIEQQAELHLLKSLVNHLSRSTSSD